MQSDASCPQSSTSHMRSAVNLCRYQASLQEEASRAAGSDSRRAPLLRRSAGSAACAVHVENTSLPPLKDSSRAPSVDSRSVGGLWSGELFDVHVAFETQV